MATLKQIRANRLNAQNCTGPSSAEGQARSSRNALKSGIHAESEVLPWEDPDERAALRAEYHNHHQPCTPQERAMVDNLVHGEFLGRRFRRSEVKIVISKIPAGANLADEATIGQAYSDASGELGRLQRRMDANNRAFHRDLDELRLLKAERPPFEIPPPLILVSPQPEPQPSETAVPEPGPPPPSPEPAVDIPPATPPPPAQPDPQPPGPDPQPPVVVLVGLHQIFNALSRNPTPTQGATLTPAQAAALREDRASPSPDPADPPSPAHSRAGEPGPRPPAPAAVPVLSTVQLTESTAQTEQIGSFRQKPKIAPASAQHKPNPAPGPRPPAPEKPRGFNPNNPHHPPIELCHNCNQLGRILDHCMFQRIPDHLVPGHP